jgi:hypothetical protein
MKTLPAPVYTSWVDYLAQTTWTRLRQRCRETAKRANRKRLLSPMPEHSVSPLMVWRVLSEARGRCAHCGSLAVEGRPSDPRKGTPISWGHIGRRVGSLEHKKARYVGGDNDLTNLAWCCLWCNTWPEERRPGATDHGGYYPDAHHEPDSKESEYVAAIEQAFVIGRRPEHDYDDSDDSEMLPDHECPEDTAMWRQTFGSG